VARKKKAVVLTDPRAIRALAHPARQRLIDELYGGAVLTATECAELVGLTPSAVSYHLRALARWGIIERAEASADGRQRPWRAPAGTLIVSSPPGVAGRAAGRASGQVYFDRLQDEYDEWTEQSDTDPWRDEMTIHRDRLWLTHEEYTEFTKDIQAVMQKHRRNRTSARHPADTRRVSSFVALIPTGEPPEDEVSGS
jgi:DNA-binding transcriptional ArsR family regulator